jgi:hypothetical protein
VTPDNFAGHAGAALARACASAVAAAARAVRAGIRNAAALADRRTEPRPAGRHAATAADHRDGETIAVFAGMAFGERNPDLVAEFARRIGVPAKHAAAALDDAAYAATMNTEAELSGWEYEPAAGRRPGRPATAGAR